MRGWPVRVRMKMWSELGWAEAEGNDKSEMGNPDQMTHHDYHQVWSFTTFWALALGSAPTVMQRL